MQQLTENPKETDNVVSQPLSDIIKKADALSKEDQRILLSFLVQSVKTEEIREDATALKKLTNDKDISSGKSIMEKIREIADGIPEEVLAQLPGDGALEHDHYIYGIPKKHS